jgi:hypothetical protein
MGILFAGEFVLRKIVNAKITKPIPISKFMEKSRSNDTIMCYENIYSSGIYKTWKDFITETAKMRSVIKKYPEKKWILYCEDYWYFLVAFVSLLQLKKEIILSANTSPSFIKEIREENTNCLSDKEIEKSLYNIAIANQDGSGGIRYFAWIDKYKQKSGLVHCCCGVGTRLFGLLPEFLYSVNDDSLYVDIYNASEFNWNRNGASVKVETITKLPYDGKVKIRIEGQGKQTFTLKLRIPAWADGPVTVTADGKDKYRGEAGSYLSIKKDWSGAHEVEFDLRFRWSKTLYHGAEEYYDERAEPPVAYKRWAFEYGPLLMAVAGSSGTEFAPSHNNGRSLLNKDPEKYSEWLKPAGKELHFNIEGYPEFFMLPYFEIKDELFSCYPHFHPRAADY